MAAAVTTMAATMIMALTARTGNQSQSEPTIQCTTLSSSTHPLPVAAGAAVTSHLPEQGLAHSPETSSHGGEEDVDTSDTVEERSFWQAPLPSSPDGLQWMPCRLPVTALGTNARGVGRVVAKTTT